MVGDWKGVSVRLGAGFAVLAVAGAPAAAQGQLTGQRLSLLPAQVETGPGTVRLDGMGGFETAVVDENREVTLLDYGLNPAGFSDDRDSWNLEFRYGHAEYAERDQRLPGNDLFINEGLARGGYYAPGKVGVGGQVDYVEVSASDFARSVDSFRIVGAQGMVNTYLTPKLTIGANLSLSNESEDVFSRSIYNIDHENTTLRGGVGAAFVPVRGVKLGARGELIGTKIDGESRGGFHTDSFEWSRPGRLYSVHGFIDRGRLAGGFDVTGQGLDGEESVRISWSEKFVFNPTDDVLTGEFDTFTEDRNNFQFKTRWQVAVTPKLNVSAAVQNGTEDFTVVANPNALGSQIDQEIETKSNAVIGGGSYTLLRSRLLLAAELKVGSTEVTDLTGGTETVNTRDETTVRVGGEYFFGETFVGRAGVISTTDDFSLATNPELDGSFSTTRGAAGIGVTPAGGIWQFDMALDFDLSSDLDSKQLNFSAYLKHIF